MTADAVHTIGHSNHPADAFIRLLKAHAVSAVGDVRSAPYSRSNPQFNRETLKEALGVQGIAYVFLGEELGARSRDPSCYRDGKVQYDLLSRTPLFQRGIERVQEGAARFRIALMCAERDPLHCHRTILVARRLVQQGIAVNHILADGAIETQEQAEERLLQSLHMPPTDLFLSRDDIVRHAYHVQGQTIAYSAD